MKNIKLYISLLIFSLSFISCEKEEIGGTAMEKMAGEWYVTAVAIDENGDVVYEDEDLFGIGHFHLDTYNAASNTTTELWVDDHGNFWDFKVKADADLSSKTYSVTDGQNVSYDSKVTISNGMILNGAATTPSGAVADSIVFTVSFDDDPYPAAYGYSAYRIAGFRYTGLTADD